MNAKPPLLLPSRAVDSHKGKYGKVLLVGGSRGMSGSIALSAMAALHTGSGLVSAATPDRCLDTVASFHPGIMTIPLADNSHGQFDLQANIDLPALAKFGAIGCGPGMTTAPGSIRIVEHLLLQSRTNLVLDADAINALAVLQWPDQAGTQKSNLVLTPHPGEMERLTGASAKNRDSQKTAAMELAKQIGATIVLKGGPTLVIGAEGCWTNTTGNPGMATAGSGDVLTGVITSLLGQGLSAWNAAQLGVWIHGLAGDMAAGAHGQAGMTCLQILHQIPNAVARCVPPPE